MAQRPRNHDDPIDSAHEGVSADAWARTEAGRLMSTRSGLGGIVYTLIFLVGLSVLRFQMVRQGPSCGGERLGPGEQCVNLDTGTTTSAGDQQGAIANQSWFWAILLGGLALLLIYLIYRRFMPTEYDQRHNADRVRASIERLDHAISLTKGLEVNETLVEYRTAYLALLGSKYRKHLTRSALTHYT